VTFYEFKTLFIKKLSKNNLMSYYMILNNNVLYDT